MRGEPVDQQIHDAIRRQFAQNAGDYRDEPLFAEGEDLRHMVKSVNLTGTEQLLDLGTGAGHTALAFARHVERGTGIDLTPAMIETATQLAKERGMTNLEFQVGDAGHLPFADESFDLVTCRFAAHHFADAATAIKEIARVLKPGGTFLLVDHYAPEDPELDAYVNQLDRMRDPSHVREHRLSEYRTWFASCGLAYREKLKWDLPIDFENWIRRARTPMETRRKLVQWLREAPPACKQTFRIQIDEKGTPVSFCLKCALLHGVKR